MKTRVAWAIAASLAAADASAQAAAPRDEGLATGVRAWVDTEALGRRLGLRAGQRITTAPSVGYPKPK
jgi:hypothetical protein